MGISSAAAAVAALQVASELEEGVTVFPDAGYKYLSDKNFRSERKWFEVDE